MRGIMPSISLTLVNGLDSCSSEAQTNCLPLSHVEEDTLRTEGFSIGFDFLRLNGITISTNLSPCTVKIEETIGRGSCSVVHRAKILTQTHFHSEESRQDSLLPQDALKVFPVMDAARRKMLTKELRVLCSIECSCLVKLKGAFFDNSEGMVTAVREIYSFAN